VDPFDASGDAFSQPIYRAIQQSGVIGLKQHFEENIRGAGLTDWVQVHPVRDTELVATWSTPIDLLFLDGDQSYPGARARTQAGHHLSELEE
jgi:hypothetical protein